MHNFRLYLLMLLFWAAGSPAFAQETNISGRFEKQPLTRFLHTLEEQYGYFFYYDTAQVSAVTVDLEARQEPLDKLLERALKDTDLRFAIDGKKVYITKGLKIVTTLPSGFFTPSTARLNERPAADTAVDFGLEQKKKQPVISENKLYEIGIKSNMQKGSAILTGTVRNRRTGEPVANASVFTDTRFFTTTDSYGNYSLTLPAGNYSLHVVAIGMRDLRLQLAVYSEGRLDIDIQEQITTLKEVIVSAQKTANIRSVQMGAERLNIDQIRRAPSLFGETDILRVITSLPGVKTVGEASTGFNVRGGSADQNLILFNEATIYNPSHFFGMFSAFNPEIIKDVELYKSSIPARFGGRLASVLDISSREGNKKNISGSAGIGPITTRLHLEGPLAKDRTSFIFGGRTTYASWLLNLLPDEYKHSKASFQDLNLGISHRIDSSNSLYFSGYFSNDRFALNSDTTYGYSNRNLTVKWKRSIHRRLSAEYIAGFDQYRFSVESQGNPVNAFNLRFGIRQLHAKANFVYYYNQQHSFDFGLSTLHYTLEPGSNQPATSSSRVTPNVVETERALESGLYVTHRYNPTSKLAINSGIRYSLFNYLGPQEISYYAPGLPVTASNVTDVKNYGKGKFIKTYQGPELRLSARYAFTGSFSVKAGYNSQRQYIHMLSNTTAIAPTDIWKLSDPNIRPQRGDQVSLGFYKNLKSNTIETSVEVYYKRIKDYLDYKPGATLLLNHNIETDVISTKGKAYGVEFLVKKPVGKLNGWVSYTYSRILLRSLSGTDDFQVNKGAFYPANYDKPHDVTLTGNFRINHRFSISANSTYSTGRPITLPIGRFFYAGSERVIYSDRNAYRIPDYFRTDFSMNIDGNHKLTQKTHNSWTVGVYNVMGRKNPYSVYFISEDGAIKGYKLSIFGSAIPFINFNIRF